MSTVQICIMSRFLHELCNLDVEAMEQIGEPFERGENKWNKLFIVQIWTIIINSSWNFFSIVYRPIELVLSASKQTLIRGTSK